MPQGGGVNPPTGKQVHQERQEAYKMWSTQSKGMFGDVEWVNEEKNKKNLSPTAAGCKL